MFNEDSRYYNLETKKITIQGREIAYKARRFLPQGGKLQLLSEATIGQGDRLDQITSKSLGAPEHFWRICDANNTMSPRELTEEPGKRIRVPVPDFQM